MGGVVSRSKNSRKGTRGQHDCADCGYDGCEWCNPKRFIEEKRKARKDKERPKYKD